VEANSGWEGTGRRFRPRALAVLAAAGLVALLVLLARGGISPEEPALEVTGELPGDDDEVGLGGRPSAGNAEEVDRTGWERTAVAPFDLRVAVPSAWTGEALVVWTGDAREAGGLYFPREDRWERLPPAPSERAVGWTAVWTGEEVLYWGGVGPGGKRHGDGAAFAPAERSWRRVPDAPIEGRLATAAVATPQGVVVWGGRRTLERRCRKVFVAGCLLAHVFAFPSGYLPHL
jgi:hypothetical protein